MLTLDLVPHGMKCPLKSDNLLCRVKFMHIFVVQSGVERNRYKLKIDKLRKSIYKTAFCWQHS